MPGSMKQGFLVFKPVIPDIFWGGTLTCSALIWCGEIDCNIIVYSVLSIIKIWGGQ